MNQLSQIIAREVRDLSTVARMTVIRATDGQTFTVTDWPELKPFATSIPAPRRVDVYAYMQDAAPETISKRFFGPAARREAMEWIETQLPF